MGILLERKDHILIMTLNRPEAKNAINTETANAIEAALDDYEADDDLWMCILTGKGDVFCAGADLKEVASGKNGIMTARGSFAGIVNRPRTKPLLAAVQGPALAGGCEIVLACDLAVVSEHAFFSLPEVKRSLLAIGGAVIRLPRMLGMKRAMEMLLTGDRIQAAQALEWGMVNKVVPKDQVMNEALKLAGRITINAPLAVQASRNLMAQTFSLPDEELWKMGMATFVKDILPSDDFQEGPRAFIEKRAPNWKGK